MRFLPTDVTCVFCAGSISYRGYAPTEQKNLKDARLEASVPGMRHIWAVETHTPRRTPCEIDEKRSLATGGRPAEGSLATLNGGNRCARFMPME
jgi:hypothetical protein